MDRRTLLHAGGAMLGVMTPGVLSAAPFPAPALAESGMDVPAVQFVFAAKVLLEPTQEIGRTPYGTRRRVPIIGGTVEGPRLAGTVVPGGADWQLQRADDMTVIEADYMIRASDGAQIHVYNRGLSNSRIKGAPSRYLRTVPQFEAPAGPHEWLNQSIFVGTVQPIAGGPPAVMVHVFRVS